MSVGVVPNMEDLANALGCKIGSLPTQYLGMPLGAHYKSKNSWDPVLERCRNRLAEWKTKYLSTGARITLIKSVLSSLPTYYLSLFTAPCSVLMEMERLQRNFLWGRSEEVFKHCLVKWKTVCRPYHSGGAGIRQLKLHNEALLGKWFWRFANECNSLWKRVIVSKYGEELGGWFSAEGPRLYGSSIWKGIRRNYTNFIQCTTWKVGRGDRTLFWNQKWLDVGLLSELFPEIYAVAANKNALVADYRSDQGSNCSWNVQLRRCLNDWELERFSMLLELLYSLTVEGNDDVMLWQLSKNNVFTVQSYYQFLQGEILDDFPWTTLWKAAAPSKVIFFNWCLIKGKILTMDNLRSRGYFMVNRCPLCLRQEETMVHLFVHCEWSYELWSLALSCYGVQMCLPGSIKSFFLDWWGHPVGRRKKKLWILTPLCLFWLIWKERNRRIFENIEKSILQAKSSFLSCLYSWAEGGKEIDLYSFISFINSMK